MRKTLETGDQKDEEHFTCTKEPGQPLCSWEKKITAPRILVWSPTTILTGLSGA
jgi:hypothetical protein